MIHHALKIIKEVCIGCSRCMNSCPTGALRIRNGKACLIEERCVDCGECYRVCPVEAIIVEHDDFKKIFDFKCRVALVPAILISQFEQRYSVKEIYSAIRENGFTHVYEVEHASVILPGLIDKIIDKSPVKPIISSYCPAIIRLIQVKFPELTENIMRLCTPVDIAGVYFRKLLNDSGVDNSDIGIFYITPCAAKIAAVKSPVGEEKSSIDGVINLDFIYNRIYSVLSSSSMKIYPFKEHENFRPGEISWSLTGGEAENLKTDKALSIDGIGNVIKFLEQVENRELKGVDFLELRACDESCAGGILTVENRFLAADRLRKRSKTYKRGNSVESDIFSYKELIDRASLIEEIKPRSVDILDEDFYQAMLKMQKLKEAEESLPGVDCGICGSPNCKSLARDYIKGEAKLEYCFFILQRLIENKKLTPQESGEILRAVWGNKKFDGEIDESKKSD
ncbi:MAG: 4Fe-4S binding protein [Candidatus Delongbacteria bacterium]|nr:4Fe-4S binding protein [Candidatus Delongbacteria bacterium]MBN2834946.1 4Fe-4S binding protein [Candidatus Delongbacteria bacterium]